MDEFLSFCCVRNWVSLVSLAISRVFGMPAHVRLVRGRAGQVVLGEAAPCPAPDSWCYTNYFFAIIGKHCLT